MKKTFEIDDVIVLPSVVVLVVVVVVDVVVVVVVVVISLHRSMISTVESSAVLHFRNPYKHSFMICTFLLL